MENEITNEAVAESPAPQSNPQLFNEDFLTITTTVVVVFTFAVINILSYMV